MRRDQGSDHAERSLVVDHLAPDTPQRVLTIGAEFAQIAGRDEPFRAEIRDHLKGRTHAPEDLAIELLARGFSVRDIEDAFND